MSSPPGGKSVSEAWEAFLKFPDMPILESDATLKNALMQGVLNGNFGLLMDDKVRFLEAISLPDTPMDAFILRKDSAQKLKQQTSQVTPETTVVKPMPETQAAKAAEAKIVRRLTLRARVPWDKLSALVAGVLSPLRRDGANITLEVRIDADSQQGISRDTVDMKVKETLKQIGAEVLEEEEK
jgi:hypothetical protein